MRDDERGVDFARLDLLQKRLHVALHVRLTGFHRQAFVHEGAERQLVGKPDVSAGDRDRSALAAAHDRFDAGHAFGPWGASPPT